MNIKDDFILSKINEGYLVGGSVRDALMGKSFVDRDVAIKGAESFAKKLAEEFNATFIVLDPEYKIYRLVLEDKTNYLDISEIQGVNIEEDLSRRDFAMNAIAIDLSSGEIIDPYNGQKDIENKVIRHIKDSNFEEDPLRILRAFRFMSTTGFELSEDVKACIKNYKHLLFTPAKERINYELMKLFGGGKCSGGKCSEALLCMDEFRILEELFPQVKEMKKVPPNTHHHLDLFHHVVETVRNIDELYENAPDEVKSHLDRVDFGGFPRLNHIKLAGFLHDIGKISTWTIEDTGRHRFIKHDDVGAKMCVPFLKDMKFSKKQIDYISLMIKNHIYPSNVIVAPDLSEKVMMRYLRKMGENVVDNIILAKADRLSARGEDITEAMVQENLDGLDKLLKFYLEKRETLKPLPKLIDGLEILKIKNIKQGPILGEIIDALKEAQISGEVNTKDDAVEFVKKYQL